MAWAREEEGRTGYTAQLAEKVALQILRKSRIKVGKQKKKVGQIRNKMVIRGTLSGLKFVAFCTFAAFSVL